MTLQYSWVKLSNDTSHVNSTAKCLKFRLDCKIDFQNTLYTKSFNIITDSIGPSIILRRIFTPS